MFEMLIVNNGKKEFDFPYEDGELYNSSEVLTQDILPDFGPDIPYSRNGGVTLYGLVAGNGDTFSHDVDFLKGTSLPTMANSGWIKCKIDNKLLFVARKPFRVGIKHSDIVPNTQLTIEGRQYRVRTLDYDRPYNQLHLSGGTADPAILYGSEWNRLMYRLCKHTTKVQSGEGIVFGSLANLPLEYLNLHGSSVTTGAYSVVRRLPNGYSFARYNHTGATTGTWVGTIASNPNAIGWRPVLELIEE